VLSESLCHLALIKGDAGRLATDDALAVARQYLEAQIPAAGAEAIIRVTRVPAGDTHDLLGAALERPLLECLHQASRGARCRVRVVSPRVLRALASLDGDATRISGHLVCADTASAVIVSLRRGAWTHLRTRRVDAPNVAQWTQSLEQAEALAGSGARDVWWCGALPPGQLPGWTLRRLPLTNAGGLA
jgi:glutathione S-transferase